MTVKMNETRVAVLAVLRNATKPMTLAEIAAAAGIDKIATGTTNAMVAAGYIAKADKTKVPAVGKRNVNTYAYASEPAKDTKVVMNETRVAVLATLKNAAAPMTLAEIAAAIGVEKLNPSVITPMVNAETVKTVGTRPVLTVTSKNVDTYVIGDNAPNAN